MSQSLARLASAALLALLANAAQAHQLIAPSVPIANLSQSDIAAQFGQWVMNYPIASSPLLDATGANSAVGDQGSYFFLGGSFASDPVVRNVTVRSNQILVINLTSVTDWMGNGLNTEALIREEAANVLGINPTLALTVNGAAATLPAGFSSLEQLRQSSPLFQMIFGPNNPAGWAESVVPAIVDGYIVAMQALAQGNYQIHVNTLTQGMGPLAGYNFSQDVTYNVTSVPEPGTWASLALGLVAIGARSLRRRGLSRV